MRALFCIAVASLAGCANVQRFTHDHPRASSMIAVSLAISATAVMSHNQISMGRSHVDTPSVSCAQPETCR